MSEFVYRKVLDFERIKGGIDRHWCNYLGSELGVSGRHL